MHLIGWILAWMTSCPLPCGRSHVSVGTRIYKISTVPLNRRLKIANELRLNGWLAANADSALSANPQPDEVYHNSYLGISHLNAHYLFIVNEIFFINRDNVINVAGLDSHPFYIHRSHFLLMCCNILVQGYILKQVITSHTIVMPVCWYGSLSDLRVFSVFVMDYYPYSYVQKLCNVIIIIITNVD